MTNKKTYKQMFTEILSVVTEQEHKDFIQKQIDLLDKKSATRKSTDYSPFFPHVVNAITSHGKPMTLTEIANADEVFRTEDGAVFSTSRMNAIVRAMGELIVRTEVKGRAYFNVA